MDSLVKSRLKDILRQISFMNVGSCDDIITEFLMYQVPFLHRIRHFKINLATTRVRDF